MIDQNRISRVLELPPEKFRQVSFIKRVFFIAFPELVEWSPGRDSDPRPTTYEAAAPTGLSYRGSEGLRRKASSAFLRYSDDGDPIVFSVFEGALYIRVHYGIG